MTQISLSKVLAIIDEERGKFLKKRKRALERAMEASAKYEHQTHFDCIEEYDAISSHLRLLNKLKKEFSNLSDSDQIPLGL